MHVKKVIPVSTRAIVSLCHYSKGDTDPKGLGPLISHFFELLSVVEASDACDRFASVTVIICVSLGLRSESRVCGLGLQASGFEV